METSYLEFDTRLQKGLELNERLGWSASYYSNNSHKQHFRRTNTALLMAMPGTDTLAFNRVVGLGLIKPSSHTEVREIIDFYREAGSSCFFVQLSPFARPAYIDELLSFNGFSHYNNWTKLYRPASSPLPPVWTELRVDRITTDQADEYGRLITEAFKWENGKDAIAQTLARTVGISGYRHYFAFDKDKPVAAAALYARGSFASMAIAGTLQEYRGKGAQSALLARRILDARNMGCKHIISETAEELPDKPVQSWRNMKKFGFEVAYLRPNFIYCF